MAERKKSDFLLSPPRAPLWRTRAIIHRQCTGANPPAKPPPRSRCPFADRLCQPDYLSTTSPNHRPCT